MIEHTIFGVVVVFNTDDGLGVLESSGGQRYRFHAISIGNGSRSLPIGQRVVARLRPTHGGVFEACDLIEAVR